MEGYPYGVISRPPFRVFALGVLLASVAPFSVRAQPIRDLLKRLAGKPEPAGRPYAAIGTREAGGPVAALVGMSLSHGSRMADKDGSVIIERPKVRLDFEPELVGVSADSFHEVCGLLGLGRGVGFTGTPAPKAARIDAQGRVRAVRSTGLSIIDTVVCRPGS